MGHDKDEGQMKQTIMGLATNLLLISLFGHSVLALAPIIDAQLGTVAFPLSRIYISQTSWNHVFRISVPCMNHLIPAESMEKTLKMIQGTRAVFKSYTNMCLNERQLPDTNHAYICTLLENEMNLMNTTLTRFRSAVMSANKLEEDYKSLRIDPGCSPIPIPSDLVSPLYADVRSSELVKKGNRRRKRLVDNTGMTGSTPNNDAGPIIGKPAIIPIPQSTTFKPALSPVVEKTLASVVNYHISNNTNVYLTDHQRPAEPKIPEHQPPTVVRARVQQVTATRDPSTSHQTLSQRYETEVLLKDWNSRGVHDLIQHAKSACYADPFSKSTELILKSYKSAIDTYIINSGTDFCSLMPTSSLCRTNDRSDMRRVRRTVDAKPGWIPWDFSVSKWMWGGLNDKDGLEINSLFKNIQDEVETTSDRILQVQNKTVSAMSTMREELIQYAKTLNTKLESLSSSSEVWGEEVSSVLKTVSDNTTITSILAMGALLLAQSSQVRDHLQDVVHSTEENIMDTSAVFASVLAKSVPLSHITLKDRGQALTYIKSKLPNGLELVPTESTSSLFESLTPICRLSKQGVLFYYTIPLIKTQYDYNTWQISSIPVDTGLLNMQVALESSVVMISETQDAWYKLSDASFTSCTTNKVRVCPFSPPHYSHIDPNCAASIVFGTGQSKKICKLIASPYTRLSDIAVLPIDGRRWLTSTPLNGVEALLRCKNNNTGLQEDLSQTLKGVQLISLPAHCALKADNVALVSYDNEMFKSVSDSHSMRDPLPTPLVNPTIQDYQTIWRDNENASVKLMSTLRHNISLPVLELKMSGMTIQNVSSMIQGNSEYFNKTFSRMDLSVTGVNYDNNMKLNLPGFLPTLVLPFSLGTFVAVQLTFDALLLMFCISRYIRAPLSYMKAGTRPLTQGYELDNFVSGLPLPQMNKKHEVYNPFEELLSTTTSTARPTTPSPTATEKVIIMIPKNVTLELINTKIDYMYQMIKTSRIPSSTTPLVNTSWYHSFKFPTTKETHQDYFWMGVMMILIALICHLMMVKTIKHQLSNLITRTTGVVHNETALHFGPETKLIVSFVVKLYRRIPFITHESDDEIVGTVQLVLAQIGTLPASKDSYALRLQNRTDAFIKCEPVNRFWNKIWVNLTWGRYCIYMIENENLDICETLPSTVVLTLRDVIAAFGKHTPFLWTHVIIEGITHIMVQDITGTRILYDSSSDDHHLAVSVDGTNRGFMTK